MTNDDETETRPRPRWRPSRRRSAAARRLLQEGDVDPQYVVLAAVRVTGDLTSFGCAFVRCRQGAGIDAPSPAAPGTGVTRPAARPTS